MLCFLKTLWLRTAKIRPACLLRYDKAYRQTWDTAETCSTDFFSLYKCLPKTTTTKKEKQQDIKLRRPSISRYNLLMCPFHIHILPVDKTGSNLYPISLYVLQLLKIAGITPSSLLGSVLVKRTVFRGRRAVCPVLQSAHTPESLVAKPFVFQQAQRGKLQLRFRCSLTFFLQP